jgi:carbamate kinase
MRMVVALGGNALLKRGETLSAQNQRRNMRAAAMGLARACAGHEVAIVHGNGPQVGLLALEAEAYKAVPPYPLDVLGAESQGMIGYVIAQELQRAEPDRPVVAVLTQTAVDPKDPAFQNPTKPIGPVYAPADVPALQAKYGWAFAADGSDVRRVVASPSPLAVVELTVIERLVVAGVITICAGGGGIPVRRASDGRFEGVEAVVDKDLTAALLAELLNADRLIILTDVEAVFRGWGTADQQPLGTARVQDLQREVFAEGSMQPKVDAACRFAERTGRPAVIGALSQTEAVVHMRAGTIIKR